MVLFGLVSKMKLFKGNERYTLSETKGKQSIRETLLTMLSVYLWTLTIYIVYLQRPDESMPMLLPAAYYFQRHNMWLASMSTVSAYLIYIAVKDAVNDVRANWRIKDEVIYSGIFFSSTYCSLFYEFKCVPVGIGLCFTYILLRWLRFGVQRK